MQGWGSRELEALWWSREAGGKGLWQQMPAPWHLCAWSSGCEVPGLCAHTRDGRTEHSVVFSWPPFSCPAVSRL